MIEILNMDCMAKRVSPLKGRKRSPESVALGAANRKRGKLFNCLNCHSEFWRPPSHIKKGNCKFCSRKCYLTWQVGKPKSESFKNFCRSRTGAKSPTWKGGVTPEHLRIRNSSELRTWRESVFLRDKHTCQDCAARCGNGKDVLLHAHHIKGFADYPELRFEIGNGVTLCKGCHYKRHSK